MIALAEILPEAGTSKLEVAGICDDSREVRPGDVFIAIAGGLSDGHHFASQAVAAGAVAVLAERAISGLDVPLIVVPELHKRRGELAAITFGHPSQALHCVGVTGTNGKTSIAYFIADMLERLGCPAGYLGTIGWGDISDLATAQLTTASAITIQQRLARLVQLGKRWAVLEVSSHALDQDRTAAVAFDVAVFSNLSRDHLDYHADFASYGAAKAKLFDYPTLDAAVINVDDEFGRSLAQRAAASLQVWTYGRSGDIRWEDLQFHDTGVRGRWVTPWGESDFVLPLYGEFSVANMSAAVGVLCQAGMPLADVVEAAAAVRSVPGRVEFYPGEPGVVVDFAHTPDALDKVLAALAPHVQGQLICVFGCGGDRDPGKRPLMAQAASKHADVLWLTSDNPRSEDPQLIVREMRRGLSSSSGVHECVDRRAAIEQAIRQAEPGDLVVIAGKGHEDYQEIKGEKVPFSDREVVQSILGKGRR
jgi:UDP-N-acetylmuramoyl-L-alanyl-D-glutamate--2,6-diaminopimelate ligase